MGHTIADLPKIVSLRALQSHVVMIDKHDDILEASMQHTLVVLITYLLLRRREDFEL